MREHLEIGSSPNAEECQQVGSDDYNQLGFDECEIYARQLQRQFPNMPAGCFFKVKANSHDFGTYYEVAIFFDDDDEDAVNYAYNIENNPPEFWDPEALDELTANFIPFADIGREE